jgi:non-specific protein-tyrosine kinase
VTDNNELSQPSESVDLLQYFYLFRQWAWLVILAALIAGGVTYYLNKRTIPVYQAATTLLVSDPSSANRTGTSSSDVIVSGSLAASTYADMLTDGPVLEQTIASLQIPITPAKLKNAIHVALVTNTMLISVTVEDTDPARAAAIANMLGKTFSARVQELLDARYAVSKTNLQAQITSMEAQINQATTDLAAATDQAEHDQIETKLTQYRTIYANLVTSLEQVGLAEAQTNATVDQVDPAGVPTAPIRPTTAKNTLLAALVGAMLAAALIVGVDMLDDRLRDPAELERRTGLTVVGVIPHSSSEKDTLITQFSPRSPSSEAFRSLRTNVRYAAAVHPLHRLLVTSPTPSDGKTTIAANLSTVLAQSGLAITLVDADLRRPRVHNFFTLSNRAGLTDLFLSPQLALNGSAQATAVHNLRAVCSGHLPPNPAELLGSTRMEDVLASLGKNSDMLLLDSPPLLSVTDAAVMIPFVDGVLLVVNSGRTHLRDIKQAASQLRQLGANLIGVVINDVDFSNLRYNYYYKSHYTNYYSYYTTGADGLPARRHSKRSKGSKSKDSQSTETTNASPSADLPAPTLQPLDNNSQPDPASPPPSDPPVKDI